MKVQLYWRTRLTVTGTAPFLRLLFFVPSTGAKAFERRELDAAPAPFVKVWPRSPAEQVCHLC